MGITSMIRYLKGWVFLILIILFLGSGIPIQAATFEIGIGAWQQIPRGSVSYTYNVADIAINTTEGIVHDLIPINTNLIEQFNNRINNSVGDLIPGANPKGVLDKIFTRTDTIDFQDDCQYDPVVRPVGRLKIRVSPFVNFSIMATPLEFEGPGRKDLDFNFLGVTFISEQTFESKLKLTHYDLTYFIDLPDFSAGKNWNLNTDVGLNVRIIDFHAQISQEYTSLSASASYTVPLPMLYLAAQLMNKDWVSIEAETRGIRYTGDYTYSLIGRIQMHITGPWHLAAGYRHDYIKFKVHDIDSEGTFQGPFMETVLIF
jgi:outer membrane protein